MEKRVNIWKIDLLIDLLIDLFIDWFIEKLIDLFKKLIYARNT